MGLKFQDKLPDESTCGTEKVPKLLIGAKILRFGTTGEGEGGGGLAIDYQNGKSKRRVVFSLWEMGMWVKYDVPLTDSQDSDSPSKSRRGRRSAPRPLRR